MGWSHSLKKERDWVCNVIVFCYKMHHPTLEFTSILTTTVWHRRSSFFFFFTYFMFTFNRKIPHINDTYLQIILYILYLIYSQRVLTCDHLELDFIYICFLLTTACCSLYFIFNSSFDCFLLKVYSYISSFFIHFICSCMWN